MNLQEVLKIVNQNDLHLVLEHADEIHEFAHQVDDSATEVLKSRGDDYILGCLQIVESLAMTCWIMEGKDVKTVLRIFANEDVREILALTMKMSIGISIMEELR